ncbi:MAG: hypothetical protein J7501_17095 [Bdellovibrio sp.]|nr:hypothetical protein [Bdellovibrio sp.]
MEYQNVDNVKIQPMRVVLGDNVKQVQKLTCRADVAGDLAGKWFVVHTPTENYMVWFNSGTDDAPEEVMGWTLVEIVLVPGDSATALAGKIATALGALATKFTAVASGRNVTISCVAAGYAHPMRDAWVDTNKVGFACRVMVLGFTEVSAGAIKDTIEISGMTPKVKPITTHATGETEQGEVITGFDKPSLKFNFYEFDAEAIKRAMIISGGQTVLPEIEDAQVLMGHGTAAMGGSKTTVKVKLHPVDLDDADRSMDWTVWKAAFAVDSFKFSGTEFADIPVTASVYPDNKKPKPIQFFAIGDVVAAGL